MIYKVIGLMSGSSLDGLDLVYTELTESGGKWQFEIIASDCYSYSDEWMEKLRTATTLNALDYQLLDTAYGHLTGALVNRFIDENNLHYKVAFIASHGHTTFHMPAQKMTAQLGDGAAIAAVTGLPVISNLRAMDVALGGQGAPIVPIGEKLLFPEYPILLNLGGIANLSFNNAGQYIAFDVCPANRVMNTIAGLVHKPYDANGEMAAMGNIQAGLLQQLNELEYYQRKWPKSLANSFGLETVYHLIKSFGLTHNDQLRTFVEHMVQQIKKAIITVDGGEAGDRQMLVTGGGALNRFLVERLTEELKDIGVQVVIPSRDIIEYKEALVMALIGTLRWRQANNVLSSVTGASRDSIGGALWMGHDA